MASFANVMRGRLPGGMVVPEELAVLPCSTGSQHRAHASERVPGDRLGTLPPLEEPYRGAVMLFSRGDASGGAPLRASLVPSGKLELAERLVPSAKTSGDGSYATFWLDHEESQRIVHLARRTVASAFSERRRSISYGFSRLDPTYYVGRAAPDEPPQDSPEWGTLVANKPF